MQFRAVTCIIRHNCTSAQLKWPSLHKIIETDWSGHSILSSTFLCTNIGHFYNALCYGTICMTLTAYHCKIFVCSFYYCTNFPKQRSQNGEHTGRTSVCCLDTKETSSQAHDASSTAAWHFRRKSLLSNFSKSDTHLELMGYPVLLQIHWKHDMVQHLVCRICTDNVRDFFLPMEHTFTF